MGHGRSNKPRVFLPSGGRIDARRGQGASRSSRVVGVLWRSSIEGVRVRETGVGMLATQGEAVGHNTARGGGEERVASDYPLPPEESSTRNVFEEFDLEALVREAYKIVKAQIEAEERSTTELGTRGLEDTEEDASIRTEDGAYAEAERERYIGTTGEGRSDPPSRHAEKERPRTRSGMMKRRSPIRESMRVSGHDGPEHRARRQA